MKSKAQKEIANKIFWGLSFCMALMGAYFINKRFSDVVIAVLSFVILFVIVLFTQTKAEEKVYVFGDEIVLFAAPMILGLGGLFSISWILAIGALFIFALLIFWAAVLNKRIENELA